MWGMGVERRGGGNLGNGVGSWWGGEEGKSGEWVESRWRGEEG